MRNTSLFLWLSPHHHFKKRSTLLQFTFEYITAESQKNDPLTPYLTGGSQLCVSIPTQPRGILLGLVFYCSSGHFPCSLPTQKEHKYCTCCIYNETNQPIKLKLTSHLSQLGYLSLITATCMLNLNFSL